MRKKTYATAALFAAAALTLSACGSGDDSAEPVTVVSGSTKAATVLDDNPYEKPDLVLTDTTGKKYDLRAETKGRPTLVYFGYTHCPDVCPTTMADIAQAVAGVPAAVRAKTDVVFVVRIFHGCGY